MFCTFVLNFQQRLLTSSELTHRRGYLRDYYYYTQYNLCVYITFPRRRRRSTITRKYLACSPVVVVVSVGLIVIRYEPVRIDCALYQTSGGRAHGRP